MDGGVAAWAAGPADKSCIAKGMGAVSRPHAKRVETERKETGAQTTSQKGAGRKRMEQGGYRLAEQAATRQGGGAEELETKRGRQAPQPSSAAAGCRKQETSPLNSSRSRCSSSV